MHACMHAPHRACPQCVMHRAPGCSMSSGAVIAGGDDCMQEVARAWLAAEARSLLGSVAMKAAMAACMACSHGVTGGSGVGVTGRARRCALLLLPLGLPDSCTCCSWLQCSSRLSGQPRKSSPCRRHHMQHRSQALHSIPGTPTLSQTPAIAEPEQPDATHTSFARDALLSPDARTPSSLRPPNCGQCIRR